MVDKGSPGHDFLDGTKDGFFALHEEDSVVFAVFGEAYDGFGVFDVCPKVHDAGEDDRDPRCHIDVAVVVATVPVAEFYDLGQFRKIIGQAIIGISAMFEVFLERRWQAMGDDIVDFVAV